MVHLLPTRGEEKEVPGLKSFKVLNPKSSGVLLTAGTREIDPQVAVDVNHKARAVKAAGAVATPTIWDTYKAGRNLIKPMGTNLRQSR